MKQIVLLVVSLAMTLNLFAQTEKGTFMLEAGTNLSGIGSFIGSTGVSFQATDNYAKQSSTGVTYNYFSHNITSYSAAPRIGYFILRNLACGADFQYHKSIYEYVNSENHDRYRNLMSGLFARKYFGDKKFVPFIEATAGMGLSKNRTDESSPGGAQYQRIERRHLYYFSGAAGISYLATQRLRINIFGKIQKTTEKPINTENMHFADSKISNLDTSLMLSFSYFFTKKTQQ